MNAFILPILLTSIIVLITIAGIIIYNGEQQAGNVQHEDKTVVEESDTWSEMH